MSDKTSRRVLVLSLLLALVLQIVELPYWLAVMRPLCVPMVVAYWALITPQPGGFVAAWLAGLLLDVLLGTVLGQNALGMVIVVYFVKRGRNLLTLFPLWQAGAALIPLWVLFSFLMFWIDGATGRDADPWLRWLPAATSALLWPPIASLLTVLSRTERDDPRRL